MKELHETEKAYIAGFVDGEGCIFATQYGRNGRYRIGMTLAQCDQEIILYLKECCGGSIYENKRKVNRKIAWTWQISNKMAGDFLRDILPYLKVKKQQAILAIELQSMKGQNSNKRTTNSQFNRETEIYTELKLIHKSDSVIIRPKKEPEGKQFSLLS